MGSWCLEPIRHGLAVHMVLLMRILIMMMRRIDDDEADNRDEDLDHDGDD